MEIPAVPLEQLALIVAQARPVRNATGGQLGYGILVRLSSGIADGTPKVVKADNDAGAGAYATHILPSSIENGDTGFAFKYALIDELDTHTGAVGDPVYLDATAGGWTLTRPSGQSIIQIVGFITVVGTVDGQIAFDLTGGLDGGSPIAETVQFGFAAGAAAGPITITGIAVADRIIAVIVNDDTTGVDTNLTAEFSIASANTITNAGGTATTGGHVEVFYARR